MPQFQMPIDNLKSWQDLPDDLTRGYIEAAFFTECNSDNPDIEHATFNDIAPESLEAILSDCRLFQFTNAGTLKAAFKTGYDESQAGRDFWFTRNGHGVGFWDRDLGDTGDDLTSSAKLYRETDMYRGDDGKVYFA